MAEGGEGGFCAKVLRTCLWSRCPEGDNFRFLNRSRNPSIPPYLSIVRIVERATLQEIFRPNT